MDSEVELECAYTRNATRRLPGLWLAPRDEILCPVPETVPGVEALMLVLDGNEVLVTSALESSPLPLQTFGV